MKEKMLAGVKRLLSVSALLGLPAMELGCKFSTDNNNLNSLFTKSIQAKSCIVLYYSIWQIIWSILFLI